MQRMLEATARAEDTHCWFRGLRRSARLVLRQTTQGRTLARIVDCGAGTGRNLDWLSEFGEAVGVELTPIGLDVGRSRGRRMVRGTVTALPLRDASVDLATSFDVLYCLDDEQEAQALQEMYRVLVPGGLALVNAAALDLLHGSHSTLTHERRRYTRARLSARLTRAGFTIERLTFTNMSLFPPALVVRALQRITGRAAEASDADLQIPAAPVNAVLDLLLRGEAALMSVTNLPIGTSLMAVARKPGP
jgi:SAM-dependent methyltransferase